jgi:hypothetical protein
MNSKEKKNSLNGRNPPTGNLFRVKAKNKEPIGKEKCKTLNPAWKIGIDSVKRMLFCRDRGSNGKRV